MSLRLTSNGGCGAALLWVLAAAWSAAVGSRTNCGGPYRSVPR